MNKDMFMLKGKSIMLKNFTRFVAMVLMMVLFTIMANGQNATSSSATDSTTPNALAKGTPALGTYGGSNFDNINLFNGNLSLTFPLASLSGRNGMSAGVVLSYNSKIWRIDKVQDNDPGPGGTKASYFFPVVDNPDPTLTQIAPGWTIHAGTMQAKQTLDTKMAENCFDASGKKNRPKTTLTLLTFTAPDGTEYELRDDIYNGEPLEPLNCEVRSRGKSFHSVDGSSATFVSDTEIFDSFIPTSVAPVYPSGYLYLRDGTRFKIHEGKVQEQRDSNGNIIHYDYDYFRLKRIYDTLGREIKIEYDLGGSPKVLMRVTIKGFGGSVDRVIDVQGRKLGQVLRDSTATPLMPLRDLFPNDLVKQTLGDTATGNFNPIVVSAVVLPSNHSWEFKYNNYAEVSRVRTPTLGTIEYESTSGPDGGVFIQGSRGNLQIFRRIQERRVYPTNHTSNEVKDQLEGRTIYGDPTDKDSEGNIAVLEEHKDSDGHRTAATVHKFFGNPITNYGIGLFGLGYKPWLEGKELETIEKGFSDEAIRTTKHLYKQREAVSWVKDSNNQPVSDTYLAQPLNDPQLIKTKTILHESQKFSVVKYDYDEFNNVTKERVHDFATLEAGDEDINDETVGTLLREVDRTYIKNYHGINYAGLNPSTNNADTHMRSLVASEMIKKGSTIESTSTYEYDVYSGDAFHHAITARTLPSNLSSTWDSSFNNRTYQGNVTSVTSGFGDKNANNPNVNADVTVAYSWYDSFGNVIKTIGPRATASDINHFSTDIVYDTAAYAYPLTTTQHTQHTSGANLDLETTRVFDYQTGAVTSSTDPNGFTTTYEYNDPDHLDRLSKVIRPQGFGQTAYTYSAPNAAVTFVHQETTLDTGRNLISQSDSDGLLRTTKQHRNDPEGEVTTETFYDPQGRVSRVNNAHRTADALTDGYVMTTYDAISRVTQVATFDKSNVSTGVVTSEYQGQIVTVTDQAGKKRRSETDSLGRLIKVTEPDSNNNLTLDTTYQYDARGNLLQVNQGEQQRFFTYDSLSHLLTAQAPESGTTSYIYDIASNLTKKTDARNIITTFTYDSLNRAKTKNYSDATPDVTYFYDSDLGLGANLPSGVTLPNSYDPNSAIGRLVAITTPTTTTQAATGVFYSYDIGGRLDKSFQLLDGTHYKSEVTNYNEASMPTSWLYPSNSTMGVTYNVTGQMDTITRNGDPFADTVKYTAAGAVTAQRLGNNLHHAITYNSRLQPTTISLGTGTSGPEATDRFKLTYKYGVLSNADVFGASIDETKNNGNIARMTIYPGNHPEMEQDYLYDELNRLKVAREHGMPSCDYSVSVSDQTGDAHIDGNSIVFTNGSTPTATADGIVTYDLDLTNVRGRHIFFQPQWILRAQAIAPPANGTSFRATEVNLTISINNESGGGIASSQLVVSRSFNGDIVSNGQLVNGQYQIDSSQDPNLVQIPLDNSIGQHVTLIYHFSSNSLDDGQGNYPAVMASSNQAASQLACTSSPAPIVDIPGYNTGCEPTAPFIVQVKDHGDPVNGVVTLSYRLDEPAISITNNPPTSITGEATFEVFVSGCTYLRVKATNSEGISTVGSRANFSIKTEPKASLADYSWSREYTYDRYGNRLSEKVDDYQTNIQVNAANNRLLLADGYSYDAAGNLIQDPTNKQYIYDAENRLVEVTDGNNVLIARYTYDGNGWRVKKLDASSGLFTSFIYNGGGQLMEEYEGTTAPIKTQPTKEYVYGPSGMLAIVEGTDNSSSVGGGSETIQYLTADHLGSPRLITDRDGVVINRRDFYPFGEEIGAGIGGRMGLGYATDSIKQRFTGYFRDNETGLDFAQARYFSSVLGRFMSSDEFTGGHVELFDFADDASTNPTFYADIFEPQSLNKYQYCLNNPLKYIDPDGHETDPTGPGLLEEAAELSEEAYQAARGAINALTETAAPEATTSVSASTVGVIAGVGIGGGIILKKLVDVQAEANFTEADAKTRNQLSIIENEKYVRNPYKPVPAPGTPTPPQPEARRNVSVVHPNRKAAKEAAEHPHPGKKKPTPPRSDREKRRAYEEQQKYRHPERHGDSKHPEKHFHERNKSRNRRFNVHHTYRR